MADEYYSSSMTEQELRERIGAPLEVSGVNGYWGAQERTVHLTELLITAMTRGQDTRETVADLGDELYAERGPTPDEMDWDEDAYAQAQYDWWEAEGTAEPDWTEAEIQCGRAADQALRVAQSQLTIGPGVYSGAQAYADAKEAHRQAAYDEAYAAMEDARGQVRAAQWDDADDETHASAVALEQAVDAYGAVIDRVEALADPDVANQDLTDRIAEVVLTAAVEAHRQASYDEAYHVPTPEDVARAQVNAAWDTAGAGEREADDYYSSVPEYCECAVCEFDEPDVDLGYMLYENPDYLNERQRPLEEVVAEARVAVRELANQEPAQEPTPAQAYEQPAAATADAVVLGDE